VRRHATAKDASVAIDFNCEADTRQDDPRRRIPRHQGDECARGTEENRIARANVLCLVSENQSLLVRGPIQHPARHHNLWTHHADYDRTHARRHANALAEKIGLGPHPRRATQTRIHDGERHRDENDRDRPRGDRIHRERNRDALLDRDEARSHKVERYNEPIMYDRGGAARAKTRSCRQRDAK